MPFLPDLELIWIMEPPPCWIIAGTTAFMMLKLPHRLTPDDVFGRFGIDLVYRAGDVDCRIGDQDIDVLGFAVMVAWTASRQSPYFVTSHRSASTFRGYSQRPAPAED